MPAPLPSWGNGAVRFEPESTEDDLDRNLSIEKRGLPLWMKDTWQPATDLESELPARRALLERWATADQAFRDSYVDRGKALGRWFGPCPSTLLEDIPLKRFVCVAEVDKKSHPDNYKRLLKILILCYMTREMTPRGLKGQHVFGSGSNDPHLPDFLQLPDQTNLDYSLSSRFLENADLRAIETTRTGTAIFYRKSGWYFIDQEALDTGLIRVVQFAVDGAVRAQVLIRPFVIPGLKSFTEGKGWELKEIIEMDHLSRFATRPLDLDTPLTDLLLGELKGENDHGVDRESWEAAIELAAPGYLELEAQGRELEYDLDRLVHPRALTHDNFVGKIEWQGPDFPRLVERA